MILKNLSKRERKRTKPIICKALMWEKLNKGNICPRNHVIEYFNGWFRIDRGRCFNDKKITAEADKLIEKGCYGVYLIEGMADIPTICYDSETHREIYGGE